MVDSRAKEPTGGSEGDPARHQRDDDPHGIVELLYRLANDKERTENFINITHALAPYVVIVSFAAAAIIVVLVKDVTWYYALPSSIACGGGTYIIGRIARRGRSRSVTADGNASPIRTLPPREQKPN